MTDPVRQPRLDDLTARFLARSADSTDASGSEVEPHEVFGGLRTDPRTGWMEATASNRFGLTTNKSPAPADWNAYASQPAPTAALPFALGLFPQQVRDPLPLLTAADLTKFLPDANRSPVLGFVGLRTWARKAGASQSQVSTLAATGVLASLGETSAALEVLAAAESQFEGASRFAWQNQKAAVLWLAGRHAEALAEWTQLAAHPIAAFNRGMTLLFMGRASEAIPVLAEAATRLDAGSGWTHFANLLLLLAKSRV